MAQPIEDFVDPVTNRTLGSLQAVRRAGRLDEHWHAEIELGYPIDGMESTYESSAREWLDDSAAVVQFRFVPPRTGSLPSAKNVIAVASGKGGVGKSTIAVNLALGLAKSGARVGLLDADIYGPSQGLMLGIAPGQRPEIKDQKFFIPVRVHGIEAISMSMLASENTPMVWRGPMASGALQQLLRQTEWTDIDYLIVDMPPGTGDIQLTLSQQVSIGGAVIVTTPQEVALADARKGIEMFAKVSVPILGITENMSYFVCDGCGKQHFVFDSDGGEKVASEYDTSLLGRLPLDPNLRMLTDSGQPPVASDPQSSLSQLFIELGRKTAAALWTARLETEPPPTISVDAK